MVFRFLIVALVLATLTACAMGAEPSPTPPGGVPIETPVADETPTMDETPGMDETPAMDETPGMDETPAVDETPADGGEEVDEAALIQTGGSVYAAQCAGCHQPDGEGIPDTYPALNQESDVIDEDPTEIIQIVLQGRDNMPSFAQLSDEEIAGVLSYIRSEWDNDAAPVMPAQVAEQR